MTEFDRFALALALTETEDSEASWGDAREPLQRARSMVHGVISEVRGADFEAVGRWQVHPAWYAEWADPAIQVGWSWDQAFRASLRRFWDEYERQDVNLWFRVQIFHLGRSAFEQGERDEAYLARFVKFWDAQNSENKE